MTYALGMECFREKPNSEIQLNGATQRMPNNIPKADPINVPDYHGFPASAPSRFAMNAAWWNPVASAFQSAA
jgi:hypothetical protein